MSIFLLVEVTFHGLVNEIYNYRIPVDNLLQLNNFYFHQI